MTYKTTKICAGEYEMRDTHDFRTNRIVRITKVRYPNDGTYWIADPLFDSNTSDPLRTKREAVESAIFMMKNY